MNTQSTAAQKLAQMLTGQQEETQTVDELITFLTDQIVEATEALVTLNDLKTNPKMILYTLEQSEHNNGIGAWLFENKIIWRAMTINSVHWIEFDKEEDALAFKLKWT